jgi:hypothetical protein
MRKTTTLMEDSRLSEVKGFLSFMRIPEKVVHVFLKNDLPVTSHPICLHHLR